MGEKLQRGQLVTVVEFGGNVLDRAVIADRGTHVVVCDPQEIHKAKSELREPEGIGFPRNDVLVTQRLALIDCRIIEELL
jgi:hypothetical protein